MTEQQDARSCVKRKIDCGTMVPTHVVRDSPCIRFRASNDQHIEITIRIGSPAGEGSEQPYIFNGPPDLGD
jgi:hypothetical protein